MDLSENIQTLIDQVWYYAFQIWASLLVINEFFRYFNSIFSEVITKLSGWKSNLLSLAAWKVLLQSVLTAMPRLMPANN